MKKNLIADISLIIVTIIWGTSFGMTKSILNSGIGPITIMMYRSLFTVIILLPLLMFRKIKRYDVYLGIKLGILIFIGFLFQTVGADYTTGGNSAFLTTLNVLFVPIILFFTTKQKMGLSTYISAVVAISGAFVMTIQTGDQNVATYQHFGDLLTVIGSIFWAMQIIKTSEYAKIADVWLLIYFQFLTMFILSFFTSILFKQSFNLTQNSGVAILYLTIFCTIIAFTVQAIATKYTSPEKASIIFTFEGFFGALFSFIIINEELTFKTLLGGLIILSALIISETKVFNKFIDFRRRKWEEKDLKKI
ncbi:MAG: EamA family transporter [Haloplasmataceae bacterium]|jgi:drug/metabolite transporter (DMT)-like permease|nr:EamA family transporter [Haloplasmataceae bacterium]